MSPSQPNRRTSRINVTRFFETTLAVMAPVSSLVAAMKTPGRPRFGDRSSR